MKRLHASKSKTCRKISVLISFAISAPFALINQASACSCTGALPPIKEMAEVDAVFIGRVVKLTKVGTLKEYPDYFRGYNVTVQLAEVIKGKSLIRKVGSDIIIYTGGGTGDCGYAFDEGTQYLFYASRKNSNLETHICTRTQPLNGAENEILELKGRLPKIRTAERPPELLLKGTISDAGYQGYVFELRNHLHQRMFYVPPFAQVFRNGRWEDYPINLGIAPRAEPLPEQVAELLSEERTQIAQEETERRGLRGMSFLSRMSARALFIAQQSQGYPWRVGIRYETEHAVDAGKKPSKSQRVVWGSRIDASTEANMLTFEQAFGDTNIVPDPLGTHAKDSDTKSK